MTSFHLKIIAIVTMFIDHIGVVFFPGQSIFRIIGRTAFPIFAFMIAEGFAHTRNMPKYLLRLLAFAVISQIPFNLMGGRDALNLRSLNIFFTLSLGLMAIALYELLFGLLRERSFMQRLPRIFSRIISLVPTFALAWLADVLHTDYAWRGVLLIVAFHLSIKRWQTVLSVLGLLWIYIYPYLMSGRIHWVPFGLLLSIPPLYLYNGEKGPSMPKYLFYIIYPLHMLLFVFIKRIILPLF